ncbi:MAG: hypothetical protein VX733_06375 [Candidatus Latescibacterota bacterium]|nr:hypothetical protein [Candidatus Latescibacterota bacterium]
MNTWTTPWRRQERELSAYADAELPSQESGRVAERLIFNADARGRLAAFREASRMVGAALHPPAIPDATESSRQVLEHIAAAKTPAAIDRARRRVSPVLVASVGILVTAGIAWAGLRKRGIV